MGGMIELPIEESGEEPSRSSDEACAGPVGQQVARQLWRHFLFLGVRFSDGQKAFVSGFAFEAQDRWFFVTAGHIVVGGEPTAFRNLPQRGITIQSCYLNDLSRSRDSKAIPLDVTEDRWLARDGEVDGMDVAFLELPANTVALLAANGVEPLREGSYSSQDIDFDCYVLLGLPAEWTRTEHPNVGGVTPIDLWLERLENERPTAAGGLPRLVFQARLENTVDEQDSSLSSVKGMSGGPIFGVCTKSAVPGYSLVAIQSSWIREESTLFASPFQPLGTYLEERYQPLRR